MHELTAAQIETMIRLCGEGWSARRIAAEIGGISRNCVIGRLRRAGHHCHSNTPQNSAGKRRLGFPKASSPPVPKPPRVIATPVAAPDPIGPLDALPDDLNACRWIAGDPLKPGWQCCGAETDGGPWCAHHKAKMYVKASGPSVVRYRGPHAPRPAPARAA